MTQVYSLILSIIAQVERIETDNENNLSKKKCDGPQVLPRATVNPTIFRVFFLLPTTVRVWEFLAVLWKHLYQPQHVKGMDI